MFESGYLTLFGKEFGEDKSQARQAAQKALVLNALENFKEFDKIFPALVAGLPIHVFKSAYSAREVSWFLLDTQHILQNDMKPCFGTGNIGKTETHECTCIAFHHMSRIWQRP